VNPLDALRGLSGIVSRTRDYTTLKTTAGHIVLLGDSIFDNRSYTRGEPDVVGHLRSLMPPSWRATLRAVDGTTTATVSRQFSEIPNDGSHLVLSLGGNDALMNSDVLRTRLGSSAEALLLFEERLQPFEAAYCRALESLAARQVPLTVCTIYNGALESGEARLARVALMMFNDVILRAALEYRASVIELRKICVDPGDYANSIEPSGIGGRKIANAIVRAVEAVPGEAASRVFAG
jgi:hypothetical protein